MTPYGLLLLTGGAGRRLGRPKHLEPHPTGSSWAGHLVALFEGAYPEGPVQVLGGALPERPDLPAYPDEGRGPASALVAWAARPAPAARRWWIVACDQVRWDAASLEAWTRAVEAADPRAERWILAEADGHLQALGSVLPGALRGALALREETRMRDLARALPHRAVTWEHAVWEDVDTPEQLARWRKDQGKPAAR